MTILLCGFTVQVDWVAKSCLCYAKNSRWWQVFLWLMIKQYVTSEMGTLFSFEEFKTIRHMKKYFIVATPDGEVRTRIFERCFVVPVLKPYSWY